MQKNIGYHTRAYGDSRIKISGGSFGGDISQETVERLTRLFDVIIKPSGTAVFVDKSGREVNLYISVDARETIKGREAYKLWEKKRQAEIKAEEEKLKSILDDDEILNAMKGLTHAEIIERLGSNRNS